MIDYASVLSSPTQESLPPYSSDCSRDISEKKEQTGKKSWKWGSRQDWVAAYVAAPHYFNNVVLKKIPTPGWPEKKKKAIILEQIYAFLLVAAFSIMPMGVFFPAQPLSIIFENKVISCGYSFGTPENATVSGVEKLFVLDQTFGKFTFSQAKVLDVAWDIVIGRGVQLVAWFVGYLVFSDALLRAIERHPASFQIFQRIALEGPSLLSLYTLIKELWRAKSHRTKTLFLYIWLSTLYIISIPMFLGAMTGYDSTSIAWVSLDDSNNIVPAAALQSSFLISGTWNETFKENACSDYPMQYSVDSAVYNRRTYCKLDTFRNEGIELLLTCIGQGDCQLNNGTVVNATEYSLSRYGYNYQTFAKDCGSSNVHFHKPHLLIIISGHFNYPGQNGTFKLAYSGTEPGNVGDIKSCATSFNFTVNNTNYDALTVNGTYGYCYNKKAYTYAFLDSRSRCLPDTANPSYKWGFSTSLSGLFVLVHSIWGLSMYILWQDAHFNSTLVKSGYQMTPLRAAFAMAKAAKTKTGMREGQLVRANTKELKQELYGGKKRVGTNVEYEIFGGEHEQRDEEGGVVRRRDVRPKDDGEMETIELEPGVRSSS
jgi:hypothetical protein